jgi:hypothetical protein
MRMQHLRPECTVHCVTPWTRNCPLLSLNQTTSNMAENDGNVVHADPNEVGMYEIESLCMNCEDNVSQQHGNSRAP